MGILQCIAKGFAESSKLIAIIVIFLIFNFVTGLLMMPYQKDLQTPPQAGQTFPAQDLTAIMLIGIISVLFYIFLQGGTLGLIKDLLKTNGISIANFTVYGMKYYLKMLGLLLIFIAIGIGIAAIMVLMVAAAAALPILGILMLLIGIIAVFVLAVLFTFPMYALVVEDMGPLAAFKKGLNLALKNFWKVLVFLLLILVIAIVIGLLFGAVIGVLTVVTGRGQVGSIIALFLNSLLQAYIAVVMMVAVMTFYLDLVTANPAGQAPQPAA